MHARLPPLLLVVLLAVAMWLAARTWPAWSFGAPLVTFAAALFAAGGAAILLLAVVSFRGARTSVDPTRPSRATSLVTDGVYRWSRNPMYLGFVLLLVAWGLYLGNVVALLFAPSLFVAYLTRYQVIPEERALEARFGDEFRAYRRKVRRWI